MAAEPTRDRRPAADRRALVDIHEDDAAAFNGTRGRREPERARVLDAIVGPALAARTGGTGCADRRDQRAGEKYTAPELPAALRSGHCVPVTQPDIAHLTISLAGFPSSCE